MFFLADDETGEVKKKGGLFPWLILLLVLILIAGGGAGAYYYLYKRGDDEEKRIAPLKEYIAKSKACGFTKEQIHEAALEQGWTEEDITLAFGKETAEEGTAGAMTEAAAGLSGATAASGQPSGPQLQGSAQQDNRAGGAQQMPSQQQPLQ